MADEGKRIYPRIPVPNWFALRRRFRSSIPVIVTPSYLASVLGMTVGSARDNVIPSLKITGIIDNDGRPTDLAKRWRDDSEYPKVCEEIRQSVYPQELLDIASPEDVDRDAVENWFAHHTGRGASLAKQYTRVYTMLCEADPNKGADATASSKGKSAPAKTTKRETKKKPQTNIEDGSEAGTSTAGQSQLTSKSFSGRTIPEIHFNIQVVLPENASPENYDAIFRSIATHLLGRTEE